MWAIWLSTFFFGKRVGVDVFGNRYYKSRKKQKSWLNEKRWVLYRGLAEPSKIPPLWYSWLHHTVENPPSPKAIQTSYAWEKPHLPNLTGTPYAYYPKGHFSRGGERPKAIGDYTSWTPSSLPPKII